MLLALGWAFTALAAGGMPQQQDEILEQMAAPTGGDFTLQSLQGPVATRDLRGKVLMLYFGYTKCPDVCPTSLAYITQTLHELSQDELQQVVEPLHQRRSQTRQACRRWPIMWAISTRISSA